MSFAIIVAAINLFPNGDFEKLGQDGHPDGYSRAPEWGGAVARKSRFTSSCEAHSGNHCGVYYNDNQGGFISKYGIVLRPETWYRFSGWIRNDVDPVMESVRDRNPPPGTFVKLMPRLPADWKGAWPKITQPILNAGGGMSDWTYYESYFRSDAVWTNLWAGIYIMNVSGTAWFDDLEVVETTEAAAAEWKAKQQGGGFRDGENLVFNGSFEVAVNDDMPDYIFTGIGAPWFTDRWTMHRVATEYAPHGGHYLHAMYYMSDSFATQEGRPTVVSFYARSDRLGMKITASFKNVSKSFVLTDRWTRYTFPSSSKGGAWRLSIEPANKANDFDLDAVMVSYGADVTPYAPHKDDGFFDAFRRQMDEKGAKINARCADRTFTGPLAIPAAKPDNRIDFRFDTVFEGEGLVLKGEISVPETEIVITNAAGEVVKRGIVAAEDLAKGVAFAKELPVGEYGVVGIRWPFRVVKPSARWCRVDNFANMAFTEEGPYFPCAFSLSNAYRFRNRIKEVADAGYNTAVIWGFGDCRTRFDKYDVELAREVLDECARCGLKASPFTPVMPAEEHWRKLKDKSYKKFFAWEVCDQPFDVINRSKLGFMEALKGHPAVRMWHYYDEVYGYWHKPPYPKVESNMGDTYREARRRGPYTLHWNNSTRQNRIYGGPESTDVTSATIYTISYTGGALASIRAGEGLANVGRKLGGRPGLAGIWLQFYSGNGEVAAFGREPSAEEMEAMMYGCAVNGIRAFWYFSMRPRSNRLFFRTGELAKEMDALKSVFAFGRRLPFAATHPDLMGTTYEYDGKLYVITVNTAYYAARGRLNLPEPYKAGKAARLFEPGEAGYADWTLADDWQPLSRHVYVISK